MHIDLDIRTNVMIEALPYLQEYNNQVVVVKYGGNAMTNDALKQAVMEDVVLLSLLGIKVVLVHGGGPEINAMLAKTGKESKFVNGLRYTDEETINIVQMVLAGKVNKDLVSMLESHNGSAVGLCGLDGNMIEAEMLNPELGFVGTTSFCFLYIKSFIQISYKFILIITKYKFTFYSTKHISQKYMLVFIKNIISHMIYFFRLIVWRITIK